MKTKQAVTHTPEASTQQWEVHSFGEFDRFEIHPKGDEHGTTLLAEIPDEAAGSPAEKEARAALIASAPELLAALEACAQWLTEAPIAELEAVEDALGENAPIAQAQSAIAKARGGK